jgi:para-aminobenzoate synthetase/4-amino-4-deoxychorismate lyase
MTGAPKIEAITILERLEPTERGVYSGALGWLDFSGSLDLSVVIRTILVKDGRAHLDVGGAIVADSESVAEYDETVAKARVLTARRPPVRLLETLAHEPGSGYRRLEEHLERLRASAAYLGMALEEGAVRDALDREAGRFTKPARVRLVIDRRGRVESGSAPLTQTVEPIQSIPRTRCCSTRRPRGRATTWPVSGSPMPTTSCSSTPSGT